MTLHHHWHQKLIWLDFNHPWKYQNHTVNHLFHFDPKSKILILETLIDSDFFLLIGTIFRLLIYDSLVKPEKILCSNCKVKVVLSTVYHFPFWFLLASLRTKLSVSYQSFEPVPWNNRINSIIGIFSVTRILKYLHDVIALFSSVEY